MFAQHCASVSRLTFIKEERDKNRDAKRVLQIHFVDDVGCCHISNMGVQAAIRQIRTKGAAGPDDIPPTF